MPTKKELRLYGDLIYQHKPTIKTVIWQILIDYFAKKNRHRRSQYVDNTPLEEIVRENKEPTMMTHFAIIKNNVVEEIIVVNPLIAETLKSKRIKFIEFDPKLNQVARGMEFLNNEFIFEKEEIDEEN